MAYIREHRNQGCVFCEALSGADNPENLVVWQGKRVFVMMNRFPYAHGHLLVCPVRHVKDLDGLEEKECQELMEATRRSVRTLGGCFAPEGFNVGVNIGKVAGAGFADHLHMHIVPRWQGDLNFMPVLADVRVISEHLAETYERLREAFSSRNPEPVS
jgi:ATP adenylyltransferase